MRSAKKLYESFRGAIAKRFLRTGIRYGNQWLTAKGDLNILIPDDLAIIGHVRAIEYDCVRDGQKIIARHAFAPGSRPVFAVGSGHGELFLLGSKSKFTSRGIMDFSSRGRAVDYNERTGNIRPLK